MALHITIAVSGVLATLREGHWGSNNLDLLTQCQQVDQDLNLTQEDPTDRAKLVAEALGGEIVSVGDPMLQPAPEGSIRVALPDAPEGMTQPELDAYGEAKFVAAIEREAEAPIPEDAPSAEDVAALEAMVPAEVDEVSAEG